MQHKHYIGSLENGPKKINNNNKKLTILAPPTRQNKMKAEGRSKCTTGGAEMFSQHTRGNLMVFIGPSSFKEAGG